MEVPVRRMKQLDEPLLPSVFAPLLPSLVLSLHGGLVFVVWLLHVAGSWRLVRCDMTKKKFSAQYWGRPLRTDHAVDALASLCKDQLFNPPFTCPTSKAMGMVGLIPGHDGLLSDGLFTDKALHSH